MGEEKVIHVAGKNRIPKAPEGTIKTSTAPEAVIQAVEESTKKATPDIVETKTNSVAEAKVEPVNTATQVAEKPTTTESPKPAPTQSTPSNSTKTTTPQPASTPASTPTPSASSAPQNQGVAKQAANAGTPNAGQGGAGDGTGLFASAGKVLKDAYAWVKNAAGLKNVALGALLGTPLMMMVNSLMKDNSNDEVGDEADLEKIKSRFDSKISRTTQSLEVIASRISSEMRNQRISDGIAGKSNITRNLIDMSLRLNESIQYLGDFINDSNLRQFKFFENVYEKLEDIEDDNSPLFNILTSFIGGFGPLIAGILYTYFNWDGEDGLGAKLGNALKDVLAPTLKDINDRVDNIVSTLLGKDKKDWRDGLVDILKNALEIVFFPDKEDKDTPFEYFWKKLHEKLTEAYPDLDGAIKETTDFLKKKLPKYKIAIGEAQNFIRSISTKVEDVIDTAKSILERVDAFLKDNAPNIGSLISSVNKLVDENSGTLTQILENINKVTERINKFTTPPEDGGDQSVLDHIWDHLYRFLYNRLTTLGKSIFSDPGDNRGVVAQIVDRFTGDPKPEIPSFKASGKKYNGLPPSIAYDQNKGDDKSVDENVAGYSAALGMSRTLSFGTPITPNPSELSVPKEIKQNPTPELPSTPVQDSDGPKSPGGENGKSLMNSIGDLQNMDFSSSKNNTELGFNAMALLISRVYSEVQKVKIALNIKEEMK